MATMYLQLFLFLFGGGLTSLDYLRLDSYA